MTCSPSSSDSPTEVIPALPAVPVRRSVLAAARAGSQAGHHARPLAGWRDATPTEMLPAVGRPAPSRRRERAASAAGAAGAAGAADAAGTAFPRVSTLPEPTRGREARRTAPTGTKGLRRQGRLRRHLRAALAGIALAAALLTGMQLYAAQGISSARQAALGQAAPSQTASAGAQAAASGGQTSDVISNANNPSDNSSASQKVTQPEWITEHTGVAYDRTNPHSSPLDLPRCTTSPSTPLPCLATISPDSRRAVVLEEDTSLTALVRK